MADEQNASSLSGRKFGNCKIDWVIDEFGFEISQEKCMVYSPEFIVRGFEETKFSMALQSQKTKITNKIILTYSLKRSMNDEGPEVVWINMIMFYSISNAEYSCPIEKLFYLKKGSENKTRLRGLEVVLKKNMIANPSFKLVCKLLVYNKDTNGKFKECSDAGLQLLSENMLRLFTSGEYSDVKLIVQNKIILAHKSVLTSRNEFLNILIEESIEDEAEVENYISVDIFEVEYSAMKKVLSYLYSGDLKHVLEEPSHAIHDCATFLDIGEIEEFYKPDELTLRSSTDIEKLTFVVFCPALLYNNLHLKFDFDAGEHSTAFHLDSDIESSGIIDLSLQSLFYDKRNIYGKDTLKSIRVTAVDKNEICLFVFSLSRYNKEETFKFCEIIKPKSTGTHSADSLMKLTLTFKFSSGSRHSSKIKEISKTKTYYDDDFTYKQLSEDLEDMFDGGIYTDILINNNLVYFRAHACILASRCSFFSDLINDSGTEEDIIVTNMEANILCMVLTYLYSGILFDVSDDSLFKVYNAAVLIGLPLLKTICSDRLKTSLEINSTLRCRMMKIAEENNDKELKKYVLDHLLSAVIRLPISHRNSFSDVESCRHC